MNKHIELVKKWLKDKDSVSLEELKANKEAAAYGYDAADEAYYAAAAYYDAADVAYSDAADAAADTAAYAAITYWIKKYEELTK